MSELDLPPFSLDVETLDLGPGVKAMGMELIETDSREPVRGKDAIAIWSGVFPALIAREPFVLDFFSHVDRVRDFCSAREIGFREAAGRCIVVPQPSDEQLRDLLERFEGETFGLRAGSAVQTDDTALEGELSKRGLDAYQAAYTRYTFCVVCELEDGWLTILSETLWPSEAIRRVRPAVQPFDVHIARPH
ncbi:MAG TPA: hypothetical protein VN025_07405 [Candidatus Dormibacteraeota bacterium]|jgi:hypothetical protein|nr:hypothetical protein [Candidatus Dormibacteraeota bacterium]